MRLSEKLRKDAEDIWNKIFLHPFVKEIFEGTLPEYKFRFYILQDYNYLISSIKNFALLASKADDVNTMKELINIATIEATGEFEGYINLLKKMNLTIWEAEKEEQLQTGISYSSFLLSTSSLNTYEEGITAVLPCYWLYAEIARLHKKKLTGNKNNLYKQWAYYYLKNDYLELVNKIRRLVDEIDSNFPYDKLKYAFRTSSRYEYMFWDSMYNMENKSV
jgi:thiaminase/transcriptional activator TenA